jgi:osmotically-inducible protein OsmY
MRTIVILILGALIGVGAYLYLGQHHPENAEFQRMQTNLSAGAERVGQTLSEKLDFKTDDIKRELERSGRVVRQKAQELGRTVSDATADARTTTAIKAKYALDPDVSALKISVSTTSGMVTLSGSAKSYDEIAKAMKIALDMDGVREVVSTIQVQ